ncbi:MAG: hypothetical protein ABFC90_09825 [Bacteroidales bacterium]|nr:hypothetical protein [Bacteroidales bacterium]
MNKEYRIEDDCPLMLSIDHFAKLANNENYMHKFIEIMKRIEYEDYVFLKDLILLEKEFSCPIRTQLVKGSGFYLGVEINKISELNRYLGRGSGKTKAYKLTFNALRNAINAIW